MNIESEYVITFDIILYYFHVSSLIFYSCSLIMVYIPDLTHIIHR